MDDTELYADLELENDAEQVLDISDNSTTRYLDLEIECEVYKSDGGDTPDPDPDPDPPTPTPTVSGKYVIDDDWNLTGTVVNVEDRLFYAPSSGWEEYAFTKNLKSINLENVETIGQFSFYACQNLESINLPKLKTTGLCSLICLTKVESLELPELITSGDFSICDMTALQSVSLPKATTIGGAFCRDCRILTTVNVPAATEFVGVAFDLCSSLEKLDLPAATKFGNSMFNDCPKLTTLILRAEQVVTLVSDSFGANSAITQGTCFVYVPDDLVDSYKTAQYWSKVAKQIKPLSELPA